jgi:hypothetical protein
MSGQKLEGLQITVYYHTDDEIDHYFVLFGPELLDEMLSQPRFCSLKEVQVTFEGDCDGTAVLTRGLRERMPRMSASRSVMFSIHDEGVEHDHEFECGFLQAVSEAMSSGVDIS